MKKLLLILLLSPLFFTACYAEGLEEQAAELMGTDALEQALTPEERQIGGTLRLDGLYDTAGALDRLWSSAAQTVKDAFTREIRTVAALAVIAVFAALSAAPVQNPTLESVINTAACAVVAGQTVGSLDSMAGQCSEAIYRLSDYSRAVLPAIFTAAAASGAPISAPTRYAAACLAMDVLIHVSQRIVLPLIYAFLALSLCRSIFDNPLLRGLSGLIKWCCVTCMTGLTAAFSAYVGITGIVTGSADAAAVKTAKTVISSALPIVGGMLSDSAGVVLAAASVVKNSAGAFALVSVCAICLGPFALLGVRFLLYKGAAAAADALPGGRISGLIGDIGTAFALLLGLLGSCAFMLFISVMSGIRVVSG